MYREHQRKVHNFVILQCKRGSVVDLSKYASGGRDLEHLEHIGAAKHPVRSEVFMHSVALDRKREIGTMISLW